MIFYYCPDGFDFPSGGTREMYRHVDILNARGIEAAVLHEKPGFRLGWFENATRVVCIPEVEAVPDSIVVVPEGLAHDIPNVFPGLRKVIFNQNCFYTFGNYPLGYRGRYHYEDVLAVMVASVEGEAYLKCAFPKTRVYPTCYGIDAELFHYDPAVKKRQIALMPRKSAEDAKQVMCILRARGETCPIVPIHEVSFDQAARILRESSVFMSFGHPEGLGLPPLEAMACGCTVVGYHGVGGREYFHEPFAFPVEFGDIVLYVKTVERILAGELTSDPEEVSLFVHQAYSSDKEAASVAQAWETILAL